MLNWIKKNTKPQQDVELTLKTKTAPGTAITHDPNLLVQLKTEHYILLEIFREIKFACKDRKYSELAQKLEQFRNLLQDHILVENVRLYIYLERSYLEDESNYIAIREMRREMDMIGRNVLAFLDKYATIGTNGDIDPNFLEDLLQVGSILTQRIETEENILFPLYMADR